jgi:hypothetical protein
MPTYDEALTTSAAESPFSNGTEFEAWSAAWCLRSGAPCRHEEQMRGAGSTTTCPLLDVAILNDRTPVEWGERAPALGREMYTCSMYAPEE